MIKSLFTYIKNILLSFSNILEKETHKIEKLNKNNLNLNLIIDQYKTATSKELKSYNDLVDEHLKNHFLLTDKKTQEQFSFDTTINAIKKAKSLLETENSESKKIEIEHDIQVLKSVAGNKVRLIKTYETALEKQSKHIEQLRSTISRAELDIQNTITTLQIASIENSIADLDNMLRNPSINSHIDVQEVLEIVEGKKTLIKAQRENDKILNRDATVEHKYTDSSLDLEIEDVINKALEE